MKSEWRVTTNSINGKRVYGVYRLLDVNAVDHSGNREMSGGYTNDKGLAQLVANALNKGRESDE